MEERAEGRVLPLFEGKESLQGLMYLVKVFNKETRSSRSFAYKSETEAQRKARSLKSPKVIVSIRGER